MGSAMPPGYIDFYTVSIPLLKTFNKHLDIYIRPQFFLWYTRSASELGVQKHVWMGYEKLK